MTPLLEDGKITWHSQLMNTLEKTSKSSGTTNIWVDVLIKLLVFWLLLIRAKQEGDWAFHLEAVKKMIPLLCSRSRELPKVGIALSPQDESIFRQCPLPLHERGAHYPAFCQSMVQNMVRFGDRGVIQSNR